MKQNILSKWARYYILNMGRQKQLKKERKTKKMIESIINKYMIDYCTKYCEQHDLKFDDMTVFEKLTLVNKAKDVVNRDILR